MMSWSPTSIGFVRLLVSHTLRVASSPPVAERFILPASRLHDFEVKNTIPSLHRLYTLAHVCDCEVRELLGWYGVPRR
jgi:hypothetical protein